jgi:hypothetical protein
LSCFLHWNYKFGSGLRKLGHDSLWSSDKMQLNSRKSHDWLFSRNFAREENFEWDLLEENFFPELRQWMCLEKLLLAILFSHQSQFYHHFYRWRMENNWFCFYWKPSKEDILYNFFLNQCFKKLKDRKSRL